MGPLPQPQPSQLPPLPGNEPSLQDVLPNPGRSPAVMPQNTQSAQPASTDQSAEPTLGQVMGPQQGPQPASAAPAQNQDPTGPQTPQQQQQVQDQQDQTGVQDAIAALASDFSGTKQGKVAQKSIDQDDTKAALDALKDSVDSGPGLPVGDRVFLGAARDDQEKVNFLNKLFGASGGSGRITKDGALQFRRTAAEKYQPVKSDNGLMELFGKTAELAAPAAEIGTMIAADAGAAALAFGSGGLAAGPAAAIGMVAGPAAAAAGRAALVHAMGIDSADHSAIADGAVNLGWNVATQGILKAIPKGYQFLSTAFKEADPVNRIGQMRDVIHAIANVTDEYGYTGIKAVDKGITSASETGQNISNLLDLSKSRLARAVNMVDQKAIELSGDNPLPSTNILQKMQQVLDQEGAQFDSKTGLYKPTQSSGQTIRASASDSVSLGDRGAQLGLSDQAGSLSQQELDSKLAKGASAKAAFGDANGEKFLNGMVDDYNFFIAQERANGGATMQDFLNRTRKYQSMADWGDMPKSPQLNEALEGVSGAAAIDRDSAFSQVLKGTPEEKIYNSAYQDFGKNIGVITDLRKAVQNKESGELIVDAMIKNKNPERLAKLKSIIGEDSNEWQSFRSNVVTKLLDDATDPSGIFVASKFNDSIKKLGGGFLDELGNTDAINRLRVISKRAERIYLGDTLTPRLRSDVEDTAKALVSVGGATGSKLPIVTSLFKLFRGNKYAVDYLTDDVYMKMAQGAGSKAERNIILQMNDVTRQIRDASKVVTHKGVQYYVPIISDSVTREGLAQGTKEAGSLAMDLYSRSEQDAPAPMPTQEQGQMGTSGIGP